MESKVCRDILRVEEIFKLDLKYLRKLRIVTPIHTYSAETGVRTADNRMTSEKLLSVQND